MSKRELGDRYFEATQARRRNMTEVFRLHTLHPRAKRTRYTHASSEEEVQAKANELVEAEGECGLETLKPGVGWDMESIFTHPNPIPHNDLSLRELPEPSGEQDPE